MLDCLLSLHPSQCSPIQRNSYHVFMLQLFLSHIYFSTESIQRVVRFGLLHLFQLLNFFLAPFFLHFYFFSGAFKLFWFKSIYSCLLTLFYKATLKSLSDNFDSVITELVFISHYFSNSSWDFSCLVDWHMPFRYVLMIWGAAYWGYILQPVTLKCTQIQRSVYVQYPYNTR